MKKGLRVTLDVVLFLLMLTLYDKRFISMRYHEIAGLFITVLLVLHVILNVKTFCGMAGNFKKMPRSWKTGFAVDVLLIVCFVWLAVSGVMCSHTIMLGVSSENPMFKFSHIFAGGLSVILLGVHIGLHVCRRRLPRKALFAAAIILLSGGVYGLVKSNEVRFLSVPFVSAAGDAHEGEGEGRGNGGNRSGAGRGMGKMQPPIPAKEKAKIALMFFSMIGSAVVITYWIAGKNKIHEPNC